MTKKVSVAVLSFLILLWSSPGAHADHGGGFPDPDNKDQYISSPSLTTLGAIARDRGRSELDRSDITTRSGTGDIEVRDYFYGQTGWVGLATCTRRTLSLRCDTSVVKFNESLLSTRTQWESVGCHEFGHTGGIGHRSGSNDSDNNSCMRSDIDPTSFDSHDLNEINADV